MKLKVLEKILNLIFKLQINKSYNFNVFKKPKLFLIHYSKDKKMILISSISLKAIRDKKLQILKLKIWHLNIPNIS